MTTRLGCTTLLIFALLLVALPLHAQVGEPRSDVAIGVSAGITLNTVSFDPSVSQNMKLAPTCGIAIRYNCEKYFSSLCGLQMEINYCNLGWKQDFSETDTPQYSYKRDMHYITVPIMARMGWGREKRGFLGYVVAGPQFGYLLSEKEAMSSQLLSDNDGLSTARKSQYGKAAQNRFDYGITAGAGVELNTLSAGHYMLDLRYYLGLADIFSNGKADYFGRSANGTLTIKLTYLFDIL